MDEAGLRREAAAFFDQFVTNFASFNGPRVVSLYAVPGLAIRSDGAVQVLQSRPDLEAFFQRALDGYAALGCCTCRYHDLAVTPIGSRAMLSSVTWDLLDAGGAALKSWRQSYNLALLPEGWRIAASTEHLD
ncbi:hypothetical protein [Ferrovibrio sp.]|uniref:hypothetical protein n=1 Tax=Ferrovibrio sp. TaxID=1917215 RepID=UPI003D12B9C6